MENNMLFYSYAWGCYFKYTVDTDRWTRQGWYRGRGYWEDAYGAASAPSVISGDLAVILRAWPNSVYEERCDCSTRNNEDCNQQLQASFRSTFYLYIAGCLNHKTGWIELLLLFALKTVHQCMYRHEMANICEHPSITSTVCDLVRHTTPRPWPLI